MGDGAREVVLVCGCFLVSLFLFFVVFVWFSLVGRWTTSFCLQKFSLFLSPEVLKL